MNTVSTLVRRELLEHRSIFIAPTVIIAIIVLASLVALVQGVGLSAEIAQELDGLRGEDPRRVEIAITSALGVLMTGFWIFPFAVMSGAMSALYLLDCLYGERKDRSVLFWRSLPVSDTQSVISKVLTGLVAVPLVGVIAFLVALVLLWLVVSIALLQLGQNPLTLLWLNTPWISGTLSLIYLALTGALWFAPFAGWFVLVSSASRGAPFLWALGVPGALAYLEYAVLGSIDFLQLLGDRFIAWPLNAIEDQHGDFSFSDDDFDVFIDGVDGMDHPLSMLSLTDPVGFLATPGLWVGLVLTALLVAGAIRMRRYHDV